MRRQAALLSRRSRAASVKRRRATERSRFTVAGFTSVASRASLNSSILLTDATSGSLAFSPISGSERQKAAGHRKIAVHCRRLYVGRKPRLFEFFNSPNGCDVRQPCFLADLGQRASKGGGPQKDRGSLSPALRRSQAAPL